MTRRRARQQELLFRSWGGPRQGAGRKPVGRRAGVAHRARARFLRTEPLHVTTRLLPGLPSLRNRATREILCESFVRACDRRGFRLVHWSVQRTHLHLIVEARDRERLARAMQGLLSGIARRLNRMWQRCGTVWRDRYHDVVLKSPRQVRHALCYVLNNARRHGESLSQAMDMMSSGPWFDGWLENPTVNGVAALAPPVARPGTWLLRVGWKRHGPVSLFARPGPWSAATGSTKGGAKTRRE